MSGFLAIARRHSRRTIVFFLCFLALSFAMEAKVGWYEPSDGFSFNVRTAKAMPTDSREIESESSKAFGSIGQNPASTSLAIFAALFLMMVELLPKVKVPQASGQFVPVTFLSPQILFRPPPAR